MLIYWPLYPQHIRDLFTQSFTTGLTTPSKRVTERQWLEAFANLICGIVPCQKCGAEVFFDESKAEKAVAHIAFAKDYPGCPYCGGHNWTVCSCGHLNCTIIRNGMFTCEWCGAQGTIGDYTGEEAITAGMDL